MTTSTISAPSIPANLTNQNATHQFDADDGGGGMVEVLEAEQRAARIPGAEWALEAAEK
jgi:hypothetical protein